MDIFIQCSTYRAKPAVSYSTLSVDELCDHVTSFEHGKVSVFFGGGVSCFNFDLS